MAVVFATRRTDLECGDSDSPRGVSCGANPHWCDGGCPELIENTLHWGLIPGPAASGLEARYGEDGLTLLQGETPFRLEPGDEITLSPAGRFDVGLASTDPRDGGFSNIMTYIVGDEAIDEARDTEPCEDRADSETGCAFAEVSKFNIGVDIVYFEDGTIWGNYGYGYALANPDGIFTRVDERDFPGLVSPASVAN